MCKRTVSCLALSLFVLCANAQTIIKSATPGITSSGITYFLPQTTIRFVITAKRTIFFPGKYNEYAERFFGINNVVTEKNEEWEIESVTPEIYGTPDTSQAYTIALNPKSSAPLVTLMPDGVLLAINDRVELPQKPTIGSVTPLPTIEPDPTKYFTSEILRASSTSKKAELVAQEIYDIRENRDLLAKGQADFNPTDGQQLQLMLQQLKESEEGLMSLFVGTQKVERHVFAVDYTPGKTVKQLPLFRFSRYFGLVDNEDVSGTPYFLTVTNETIQRKAEIPEGKKKSKEILDLRYRVPGRAKIVLENNEIPILEFTSPIAQYGHIEHLGKELFNKKYTTKVKLNPITGNIEKIYLPTLEN